MSSRSSAYTHHEDMLLCRVYMEVSQDPRVGVYQTSEKFWIRIEMAFNSERGENSELRSQRSLQARIQTIEKAAKKLHSCIRAIENRHQSGVSNEDIMLQAKVLLMEDTKYKSGLKFDHVWGIIKDFEKFQDCGKRKGKQSFRHISSESEDPNPEEQASLGISCSPLNLDDDLNSSGWSPSKRPIGAKKAKLKRKKEEESSSILSTLSEGNKQLLEELKKSSTQLQNQLDRSNAHKEASHALKEAKREDKILFQDLSTITDPKVRSYFEAKKEQNLRKRTQAQQFQTMANDEFGAYFHHLGVSGSELQDY